MDGGEHVGRKEERAAREQLGDSLAYQVGLFAFAVGVGAGISFANEFANFVEPFFAADVGMGLVAKVVGHLQAVDVLQTDGDSPTVPAPLFRSVFGSRPIFEIVEAVGGHNGYLGRPAPRRSPSYGCAAIANACALSEHDSTATADAARVRACPAYEQGDRGVFAKASRGEQATRTGGRSCVRDDSSRFQVLPRERAVHAW